MEEEEWRRNRRSSMGRMRLRKTAVRTIQGRSKMMMLRRPRYERVRNKAISTILRNSKMRRRCRYE